MGQQLRMAMPEGIIADRFAGCKRTLFIKEEWDLIRTYYDQIGVERAWAER